MMVLQLLAIWAVLGIIIAICVAQQFEKTVYKFNMYQAIFVYLVLGPIFWPCIILEILEKLDD